MTLGLLALAMEQRNTWASLNQQESPDRSNTMNTPLELTGPEAGLLLAASVSLADDNPSASEEVLLKKYFTSKTAEELELKLQEAGISYPDALPEMEENILQCLKKEPALFQKRSLAVCLELAMVDGTVDQQEMILLNRYCNAFGIALHDADLFREKKLRELNETGDYYHLEDLDAKEIPLEMELGIKQSALALLTLTAFADDDPSEQEVALIREYFSLEDIESLTQKMEKAGASFPEDLPRLMDSILKCMKEQNRQEQLKYLTLLHKTAAADGKMDPREVAIIEQFCTELCIGPGELESCSPLLSSMFRS